MKIWLDTERPAPKGWICTKNYSECCALLLTKDVTHLSLDHNLDDTKTGYNVCLWMIENEIFPKELIQIHTANPVGRDNMNQLLTRYAPLDITITIKFSHNQEEKEDEQQ